MSAIEAGMVVAGRMVVPIPALLREAQVVRPGLMLRMGNPLVHTNAQAVDPVFYRRLLWRTAAREEYRQPILIGRYGQAVVSGGGPHILLGDGQIAAEYMPTNYTPEVLAGRLATMAPALAGQGGEMVAQECLYAAYPGLSIWGHWLIEMLPRIVLAEQLWPGRFTYVLPASFGPAAEGFLAQQAQASLRAYGIGAERLLMMRWGVDYRFSALWDLAGMPTSSVAFHPAVIEILRGLPGLAAMHAGGARLPLTAVLRGGGEARRLHNRAAIAAAVERLGAGLMDPLAAPFMAQVMAFARSDVIIGELGSNLTAAIYAAPGSGLVTLAPSGWDDNYLLLLLQMMDVFHADLRGPSDGDGHEAMRTAPYAVDEQAIAPAVAAVRAAQRRHAGGGGEADTPQTAPDVTLLDRRTLARQAGETVLAVRFGAEGNADACALEGFSAAEPTARWSVGPRSAMRLVLPAGCEGDLWMEIEGGGYTAPRLAQSELSVTVNGVRLAHMVVGGPTRVDVPVPAAVVAAGAAAIGGTGRVMRVEFSHPICPPFAEVSDIPDWRPLGFYFTGLRLRRRAAGLPPWGAGFARPV